MKLIRTFAVSLLILGAGVATSNAWLTAGHVFCDANQSERIDTNDIPIPGVLVVVTNLSGTYSNGVYTTAPEGGFVMNLPDVPDTYVEHLHPATLPADAIFDLPPQGVYTFALTD